MKTFLWYGVVSVFALALAACGDDGGTGGSGGAPQGGGQPEGGAGDGGDGQGGDGDGGDGQGGDGQGGDGDGGDGQGGNPPSNVTAEIEEASLFGNCKPIIGDDPLVGSFTAAYTNDTDTAGTATINEVKVRFQGNTPLTWTFDVTPPTSGSIAGMSSMTVMHTKVADSGSGSSAMTPCDFCGSPATLTVEFDGIEAELEIAQFDCAF